MTKSQELHKKSTHTSVYMLNNTFNSSIGAEIDKSLGDAKSLKMLDNQRRSDNDGPYGHIAHRKINLYNFTPKPSAVSFQQFAMTDKMSEFGPSPIKEIQRQKTARRIHPDKKTAENMIAPQYLLENAIKSNLRKTPKDFKDNMTITEESITRKTIPSTGF
jgi:hypothetical protein